MSSHPLLRLLLLLLLLQALFVRVAHAQITIIDNNYNLLNHTMTCRFATSETQHHRSDGRIYLLNPRYIARHVDNTGVVLGYLYNMAQHAAINERMAALCLLKQRGTEVLFGSDGATVSSPCEYCYTEEGLERALEYERTHRGGKHVMLLVFILPFAMLFSFLRMCHACVATYKLYTRRDKASKDMMGAIGIDVRSDSGEISE